MSIRLFLWGLSIAIGISFFLFISPIQQDLAYHEFVGDCNHPHEWCRLNVWSNIGFMLIGIIGVTKLMSIWNPYVAWVALGLIMTALGSTYYHLHPDNDTLFWDRLPMTIVFSGFFAAAWQYYYPSQGWHAWLCLLIGVASVLYWKWSMWLGFEDLRPYVLVQFLPIIVLIIWSIYHPNNTMNQRVLIVCLLVGYMLAKMGEHWDVEFYHLTNHYMSGHTLKHLLAAVASCFMIRLVMDWQRENYLR
ncbi:MAG: hypothetical protein U0U66_01485 [Cytophagaceae bacterium]